MENVVSIYRSKGQWREKKIQPFSFFLVQAYYLFLIFVKLHRSPAYPEVCPVYSCKVWKWLPPRMGWTWPCPVKGWNNLNISYDDVCFRNFTCVYTHLRGFFFLNLLSWDHNGQGRHVASVATIMVTKVMTSCQALAWLRLVLSLLASHGGSMATVNLATNMRKTHVPPTLKEVNTLISTIIIKSKLGN